MKKSINVYYELFEKCPNLVIIAKAIKEKTVCRYSQSYIETLLYKGNIETLETFMEHLLKLEGFDAFITQHAYINDYITDKIFQESQDPQEEASLF